MRFKLESASHILGVGVGKIQSFLHCFAVAYPVATINLLIFLIMEIAVFFCGTGRLGSARGIVKESGCRGESHS